jgi:hypothetical protein
MSNMQSYFPHLQYIASQPGKKFRHEISACRIAINGWGNFNIADWRQIA